MAVYMCFNGTGIWGGETIISGDISGKCFIYNNYATVTCNVVNQVLVPIISWSLNVSVCMFCEENYLFHRLPIDEVALVTKNTIKNNNSSQCDICKTEDRRLGAKGSYLPL